MKIRRFAYPPFVLALCSLCLAQSFPLQKKRLLVVGEEKGYRHESVSHAMATIERLGSETGLWETTIRTDTEALTKKKLEFNAKNLNDFDAVLFFTGGDLEMDALTAASFVASDPVVTALAGFAGGRRPHAPGGRTAIPAAFR